MNGFGSMLKDYLEYYKISQTDFADRLGISQKHMNEIINGKTNISVELMLAISLLTNIDANLIYYVENKKKTYDELMSKYNSEKEINKIFNSYSLNEMEKRGWIKLKDKSSFVQKYMDLLEYLNVKNLDIFESYLDKRYLFKKKDDASNKKIFLWIKHCDNMIKSIDTIYDPNKLDNLLNELKVEQNKKFNIDNLVKLLEKYGIILYVESALDGSKVRGCIKVMVDTPVIYMTTYLKEKSSFYFTLYHELMHLKHDYNMLKKTTYVEEDNHEDEIDKLALNEMISEDIYQEIIENYSNRESICKNNNIPLCFLYSRLAKEGKIKYSSKDYLNNVERIN